MMITALEKYPSQMTIFCPLHQSCLKVDNLSPWKTYCEMERKIYPHGRDEEKDCTHERKEKKKNIEPICGNICKGQLLERPCRL